MDHAAIVLGGIGGAVVAVIIWHGLHHSRKRFPRNTEGHPKFFIGRR